MSTPKVSDLGEILAIGPRLIGRSRSQFALLRSLIGYLPCLSAPSGTPPGTDAPVTDAPVTAESVDVLSVLEETAGTDTVVESDLPPSVRSRHRSADTPEPASGVGEAGAPAGEPSPLEADLPIPDYDSLAASQVVPKLATLDQDELRTVGDYERAHRARRTILNRVSQLQKG